MDAPSRARDHHKTTTHTLCEPVQSKWTWTFQKSHSMREPPRKMPRPKIMRRPRPTLRASLRSRNGHGHVTRGILCENSPGKCCAPDGSRFVQACAIEMDMDISQEAFYARILTENAAPQMDPETATHTSREPAQSKWIWTSQKSNSSKFSGKMLRPRWIPRPRPTLCASLCSRNAHGHVTRAILCEHFQENAGSQRSTLIKQRPYSYGKHPLMRTHCFKYQQKYVSPCFLHVCPGPGSPCLSASRSSRHCCSGWQSGRPGPPARQPRSC